MKAYVAARTDWATLAFESNYKAAVMAARLHVSQRTLERHFKKQFAMTPREWLKRRRAFEGKLLAGSGLSTKEIAHRLGYKHASNFCTAFKAEHGTSSRKVVGNRSVAKS